MMNDVVQFWQVFVSESDMVLSINKRSPAPSLALVLWLRFDPEFLSAVLALFCFGHTHFLFDSTIPKSRQIFLARKLSISP